MNVIANSSQQAAAYTSPRADVTDLVPPGAMSVLDVGCSNGALGASLKSAVPGRRVWGIEMDAGFASQAATRLDRVLNANLETFDWRTELQANSFECIVFADVLEHLVEPAKHVAGALHCLKQNGSIVISLPNIRHHSALISIFGLGKFPRHSRGLFDSTHLRWFTISDGRRLLTEAGLVIDAESFSLRAGDQGGGRINRALNRLPERLKHWFLLREFFAYQYCLRARRPTAESRVGSPSGH